MLLGNLREVAEDVLHGDFQLDLGPAPITSVDQSLVLLHLLQELLLKSPRSKCAEIGIELYRKDA